MKSFSAVTEINVHNMTRVQALAAVEAAVRRANSSVYRLRIIHGYHGGTVIRDAVRKTYASHPKVKRVEIGLNPGETDLVLREF